MKSRLCKPALLLLLLLISALSFAQSASTSHRRTLDELIDESAYIVRGQIVSARVEPHPELKNLKTVVVTMRVEDSIKGDAPRDFVYRQFVWDMRAPIDDAYRRKHEVLLFLRPPSRYGLTSPAGLSQGIFTIQRDASGKSVATNSEHNVGLFKSLQVAARRKSVTLPLSSAKIATQASGPVPANDLVETVRSFVARSK